MGKLFKRLICLCLVSLFQSTTVYAADEGNPLYLSGKFIAGIAEMDDIQNSGAITGTASSSEIDDAVGGFSGAVGYQWRQFRFEAEYLWRYRFDFDDDFNGVPTSIKSDVETQSFMLNTIWEYQNQTGFTPYLGAGLGWAEHEASTERRNGTTNAVTNLDTTADNFIWALMLGVTYSMTDSWDIDVGYRYADLGDVEIGPFADGGKVDTEYTSHDFTIGVSYDF